MTTNRIGKASAVIVMVHLCTAVLGLEHGSQHSLPMQCFGWPFLPEEGKLVLNPKVVQRGYVKAVPSPNEVTWVNVSINIDEIDTLKDEDQKLTMTMSMNFEWEDVRLKMDEGMCDDVYNSSTKVSSYHDVSDISNQVWLPPVRINKLWRVDVRKLFTDDTGMIYIQSKNKFVMLGTFNIAIKCDFFYSNYPFDKQICILENRLIFREKDRVCLRWDARGIKFRKEETGILLKESFEKLQESSGNWARKVFQVISRDPAKCHRKLEILFEFKRYPTSHIIQTFLPSSLLVIGSLVSLWVPNGHVPARMTLAVTSSLTLMSMINSVFSYAPRTSYLKAIDIWLMTGFFFTFVVLLEYCIVLYLIKSSDWYDKLGKKVPSQDKEWRMKAAFILEKWAGILTPLSFLAFTIWYVVHILQVEEVQYDDKNYLLTPISV